MFLDLAQFYMLKWIWNVSLPLLRFRQRDERFLGTHLESCCGVRSTEYSSYVEELSVKEGQLGEFEVRLSRCCRSCFVDFLVAANLLLNSDRPNHLSRENGSTVDFWIHRKLGCAPVMTNSKEGPLSSNAFRPLQNPGPAVPTQGPRPRGEWGHLLTIFGRVPQAAGLI